MRRTPALLLFLLLCSLGGAAMAGEVTFSTAQSEYVVPLGEEVEIPVSVQNSWGADIPGMITYRTSVTAESGGISSVRTSMRAESFSVRSDMEEFVIGLPARDEAGTVVLSISFDYSRSGTDREVNLGPITVQYGGEPSSQQASQGPLAGTEQQSSSTSAGQSSSATAGQAPRDALQEGQMAQDADALREHLQEESRRLEAEKEAFGQALRADPTYRSVTEALEEAGYTRTASALDPSSNTSGTFSETHAMDGADAVDLEGAMEDGAVEYLRQASPGMGVMPAALASNATYGSYLEGLESEGFLPSGSVVNTTPERTDVAISFTGPENETASITAVVENGTVTAVEMERQAPLPLVPLAAAFIFLAMIAAIYLLLMRMRDETPETSDDPDPPTAVPLKDPVEECLRLLDVAEAAYADGDVPAAYRMATRALRILVSWQEGDGTEVTDEEARALLERCGHSEGDLARTLGRSGAVGFGGAAGDGEEFMGIVASVRERIPARDEG
ncbi:hypothetical protein [Methanofollis fontis]|uniref:Uncharacterized protein n=1 Tax=Methanofollis fontis TaxID=2052832 RepID=A0A483CZW4_9EURY|nr:hypothetical protein [Methanofollis fontis]TAJ45759.1 hypothetical protein CUJ86_03355 [Methanofollis fontis]